MRSCSSGERGSERMKSSCFFWPYQGESVPNRIRSVPWERMIRRSWSARIYSGVAMTVLTVSHDLGFVNREIDHVICVNRRVTVHEAAEFSAETANEVYHHEVNLIKHDHACFCNCEHRQSEPGEECCK